MMIKTTPFLVAILAMVSFSARAGNESQALTTYKYVQVFQAESERIWAAADKVRAKIDGLDMGVDRASGFFSFIASAPSGDTHQLTTGSGALYYNVEIHSFAGSGTAVYVYVFDSSYRKRTDYDDTFLQLLAKALEERGD